MYTANKILADLANGVIIIDNDFGSRFMDRNNIVFNFQYIIDKWIKFRCIAFPFFPMGAGSFIVTVNKNMDIYVFE